MLKIKIDSKILFFTHLSIAIHPSPPPGPHKFIFLLPFLTNSLSFPPPLSYLFLPPPALTTPPLHPFLSNPPPYLFHHEVS